MGYEARFVLEDSNSKKCVTFSSRFPPCGLCVAAALAGADV